MKKAQHPAQGRCTGRPAGRQKKSHRVRGPQAANEFRSIFNGGVYVAKNTLRGPRLKGTGFGRPDGWCRASQGAARSETPYSKRTSPFLSKKKGHLAVSFCLVIQPILFSFRVRALFLWAALFLCSRPLAAALSMDFTATL